MDGPRIWVTVPTFNEAGNVERIVRAVLAQLQLSAPGDHRVLIVDDASPDGTGRVADALAARLPGVEVLHRAGKQGLGRAYRAGFEHALAGGAELVIVMDADYSHDPGHLPELLAAANGVRFMSLAVRLALGQHISYEELPPCDRVAYLLYVHAPQEIHTVTAVEGLSQLKETAGVDEIVLKRGPGQPVDWREGNHGYVYSVFGTVADHEELRHLYGLVSSLVTIEGE